MKYPASHIPYLENLQALVSGDSQKPAGVFLIGGFLRDYLLGRESRDFDFAVQTGAVALAEKFAKQIRGAFVLLDVEHGCGRVVKKIDGKITTFDFADYRAKTLRGDLAHRDFTINTLAVDLLKIAGKNSLPLLIQDQQQGLRDLKLKTIRMVSAAAMREDPLRMLRAFSLRAAVGFKIERTTLARIRVDADLIRAVSMERVRDELFKILASPRAAAVLTEMDRAGLLAKIIPQITVMGKCAQGGYHHLDVWKHTLESVRQLENILNRVSQNPDVAVYLETPVAANHSRLALIRLALLLHDIGKPETRRFEEGRFTFHSHEHAGKRVCRYVAKQLKLSVPERHSLENLVLLHLRPGYLANFRQPTSRAVYRFMRDAGELAPAVLILAMADQAATAGPLTTKKDAAHHTRICEQVLEQYFAKLREKPFVRLINGDDLIRGLRLTPSPLFARILSAVEEQQALGKIKTKDEALAVAKGIAEKLRGRNMGRGRGKREN
ncbi:MAG: HD domain-containing protein [Candidatus Omnitrophica bacterium]|nr:HD domain-containing protein [Candidatus Omnitrophota bacterium]